MIQLTKHCNDSNDVVPQMCHLNFELQLKECYLCLFKTVTANQI